MFEYLQLEELQRWEGNQLLHTERLTLYQVHLETNETLIIAPTTSAASKGCVSAAPHPVGGPGPALCRPRKQQLAPTSLGTESASRGAWGTETELHILASHGTRWLGTTPGVLPKAAAMVWSSEGWLSPEGRSGRV